MTTMALGLAKKGKRKVQGVPQSQTAAHLRHQEEEETDKTKQAQIEQTHESTKTSSLFPKPKQKMLIRPITIIKKDNNAQNVDCSLYVCNTINAW